jgi:hypothetical protein
MPTDQVLTDDGDAVSSTVQSVADLAGNIGASNVVKVKIDRRRGGHVRRGR